MLIRKQELDSTEWLRVFTNKNVDGICNVMRKSGSMNANERPDRGQQVSVITQENLNSYSILGGDAPLIGRL